MKFTIFDQRITLIVENLKYQANAFSPSDNKSKKFLLALAEALESAMHGCQESPFTLPRFELENGSELASFLTDPRRKRETYRSVVDTIEEVRMICRNAKEEQEQDPWSKRQIACRILIQEILKAFLQGEVGLFFMSGLGFLWRNAERMATSDLEILEVEG